MLRRRAGLVSVAAVLAGWAAVAETGLVRHRAVAGPIGTARAIGAGLADGTLPADLLATVGRAGLGVALGLALGLPLGLWIGTSGTRRALLEPGADFLRSIPPLLVFPLLLLALGYGEPARVGAVAYATSLVIVLHVAAGVRLGRPERRRALVAMGASRAQRLRWLHLYEALPGCLTALRHAVSTGLVVAVVTEMVVGAPAGLGSRAVSAQIAYDTPGLYAVIAVAGAVGYGAAASLVAAERRLTFWARPDDDAPHEERT